MFGVFALLDGIFAIVAALRFAHPDTGGWWAFLVQGILGVGVGVVTFFQPYIVWLALGYLVAFWAIVTGVFGIAAAVRMRRDVPGEIFLIITGLLSIAAGIYLALNPVFATIAWTLVIAIYAFVGGIAQIALSFKLRGLLPKSA